MDTICRLIEDLQKQVGLLGLELHEQKAASAPRPSNKPKLTKREVEQIRKMHRTSGLSQRAIADIYDVNHATINRILSGQYHK